MLNSQVLTERAPREECARLSTPCGNLAIFMNCGYDCALGGPDHLDTKKQTGLVVRPDYLRPQDVLLACRLYSLERSRLEWTYANLAVDVGLSTGESHNAADRCRKARVLAPSGHIDRPILRDLLTVVVPLVYIPTWGPVEKGMPTAGPLCALMEGNVKHVWAAEGNVQGVSVTPIYPSVPWACRRDPVVYELMALADSVRVGADPKVAKMAVDKILELR